MNIQGTSSVPSYSAQPQGGNAANTKIKAIDKQIENIRERLKEVRNDDKLDSQERNDKIKAYEQQIQLLEQQKQQILNETRQKQLKSDGAAHEDSQQSEAAKVGSAPDAVAGGTQNMFIAFDSLKQVQESTGLVREQIKGALRLAESDAYTVVPRSDPKAAGELRDKLANIDSQVLQKAQDIEAHSSVPQLGSSAETKENDGTNRAEENGERKNEARLKYSMEPGQWVDQLV